MELMEMKPCAFCVWANHDYPQDAEHEHKHHCGWHSCDIHGGFRRYAPDCGAFAIAQGVKASY